MIYNKGCNGAVGNNITYWQCFEYMFVLSKGMPKTINLIRDRENLEARIKGCKGTKREKDGSLTHVYQSGYQQFGRRTNIWQYLTGKGHSTKDVVATLHPAIFPEKLVRDHIKSWSNEGDVVLDPFMGSGTTAKVARALGRKYIGFEISQQYVDLANKRLQETKTLFD